MNQSNQENAQSLKLVYRVRNIAVGKALIFLHVKTIVKELDATATIIVVTAAAKMINVKIVLHGPTGGPTDDTPLLSETVIIIIAVSAMVFVVSIIVASLYVVAEAEKRIS